MSKAILISIQPQHAVNILNGDKTLELRKTVSKDFVGWVYIYITKGRGNLVWGSPLPHYIENEYVLTHGYSREDADRIFGILNGKVVARFWFDEYAEIKLNTYTSISTTYFESFYSGDNEPYEEQSGVIDSNYLEDISQVSFPNMKKYAKGKTLYAWHIKQLEIFDEPMQLSDFYIFPKMWIYAIDGYMHPPYYDEVKTVLSKAPPSWQYVWLKELESESE